MSIKAAPGFLALLFLLSACQPQAEVEEAEPSALPVVTVTPVVLAAETAEKEQHIAQPPEKTAAFFLELQDELVQAGEEFVVCVLVDTGGQEVDTIQVSLNFDSKLLEVVELRPGEVFDTELQSMFDNQAGMIDYAAGLLGGKQGGQVEVMQIELKVLQETAASTLLSFNFGLPRETGVYLEGYSVLKEDGAQDFVIPLEDAPGE